MYSRLKPELRRAISVTITRVDGHIRRFKSCCHGDPIVCSAVSALTINTVNAIEQLTDAKFRVDYRPEGGFMEFALISDEGGRADLLLEALALGLGSIADQHHMLLNYIWTEGLKCLE